MPASLLPPLLNLDMRQPKASEATIDAWIYQPKFAQNDLRMLVGIHFKKVWRFRNDSDGTDAHIDAVQQIIQEIQNGKMHAFKQVVKPNEDLKPEPYEANDENKEPSADTHNDDATEVDEESAKVPSRGGQKRPRRTTSHHQLPIYYTYVGTRHDKNNGTYNIKITVTVEDRNKEPQIVLMNEKVHLIVLRDGFSSTCLNAAQDAALHP